LGFHYVVEQGPGRVKLGVATNNFFFAPAVVGQVNEVAQQLAKAVGGQHALYQGKHRIKTIYLFGQTFNPAPGVKEIVRRKKRPCFGIGPIADHTKGIVVKQLGNIAAVTHRKLFVCLVQSGFFAYGAFEFKHHQRQAIYVQNTVGDAFFVASNFELVYKAVNVGIAVVGGRFWLGHHME